MEEKNLSSLDWNALLQKTEECVMKCEDFYTRDEPMTGIEEERGVEHAYYEAQKMLEEAESQLRDSKVTPTPPIRVEEEEAPLDAKTVKSVLDSALVDATNLVQGIEKYLDSIENLSEEDIESAVETVKEIETALKYAKEMGFEAPPEGSGEKEPMQVASPPAVGWALSQPPKTGGEEE